MLNTAHRAMQALFLTAALLVTGCAGCGTPALKLSPSAVTLLGGQRQTFTATVTGVSNPAVNWTVVEQDGGSVTADGVYTAPFVKNTYHVKAASVEKPELTATAEVTVSGSVSGMVVSISPPSASVGTGDSVQFAASVAGGNNATVLWTVLEGAPGGSVSATGLYTAPSTTGTFHVVASAESDPGAYAMAEVTVTQGSNVGVTINPTSFSMGVQQQKQFSATVTGATDTTVTWKVQEANGGAVSAGGLYTSPATPGTYHVVATANANASKSATATVTVLPTGVTVSPAAVTLEIGTTQQFTATVTGASNTAVNWTVQEGANGGSVSGTGLYTPPSVAGTYHVVATSVADNTKTASATVTVINPVTVTVDPLATSLSVGQKQQFTATVTGSTNQNVTWSVQQAGGGSISATGEYTAPASVLNNTPQTFNVVATWTFGSFTKTGTAAVTVAPGVGVTLSPAAVTLAPSATQPFTATVTGNATTTVTWSVDEGASGGTVDQAGKYTAPAGSGTYHVRATSVADTTKFARATVVVLAPAVSISGTVTYGGAMTGRVYIIVAEGDDKVGMVGTSVELTSGSANFTIEGLKARGNFRIRAFMDTTNTGTFHKAAKTNNNPCNSYDSDPFIAQDLAVTGNGNVANVTLPLADGTWNKCLANDSPSALRVVPFDEGVLALYDDGASGLYEICPRYTLYWGSQPKPGGNFRSGGSSAAGSMTFNASTPNMVVKTGLVNNTPLYFSLTCTDALLGSYADAPAAVTPNPYSASAGTFSLSGTVNSTGLNITNAPLIVAALSDTAGYVARVSSPTAIQTFSFPGVAAGAYQLYAVRDVGGNGEFSLTDPNNFFEPLPVSVSANVANQSLAFATTDGTSRTSTRHVNDRGSESYGMTLTARPNIKRPVQVRITTAAKLTVPVDLPLVDSGGGLHSATFDLGGIIPAAGDSYTLAVTYSDGTTGTLTATVRGVLPVPVLVSPAEGGTSSKQPLFTWNALAPVPSKSYLFSFELHEGDFFGATSNTIASKYDMPSSTTSLPFNQLGIPDLSTTSLSNLFNGWYDWSMTAEDADGNWSRTIATFSVQ